MLEAGGEGFGCLERFASSGKGKREREDDSREAHGELQWPIVFKNPVGGGRKKAGVGSWG